jgi:hypothetical protein
MYINQLHPAFDEIDEPVCLSVLINEISNLINIQSNKEDKNFSQEAYFK